MGSWTLVSFLAIVLFVRQASSANVPISMQSILKWDGDTDGKPMQQGVIKDDNQVSSGCHAVDEQLLANIIWVPNDPSCSGYAGSHDEVFTTGSCVEAILVALGIPAENFRFFQCTEQSSYCRELEYSTLESYNSTTKDTDVVRIVLVNNGPGTPLGYVPANIHFGTPDPRVPCYMALLGRQNIQGDQLYVVTQSYIYGGYWNRAIFLSDGQPVRQPGPLFCWNSVNGRFQLMGIQRRSTAEELVKKFVPIPNWMTTRQ